MFQCCKLANPCTPSFQPASNMAQFSNVTIVTLLQFYNVTMLNCYNVTISAHEPILAHPPTCLQRFPTIVQFSNFPILQCKILQFYTFTLLQFYNFTMLNCYNVPSLANPPTWFQHFPAIFPILQCYTFTLLQFYNFTMRQC